jgi:hypothetical protein
MACLRSLRGKLYLLGLRQRVSIRCTNKPASQIEQLQTVLNNAPPSSLENLPVNSKFISFLAFGPRTYCVISYDFYS